MKKYQYKINPRSLQKDHITKPLHVKHINKNYTWTPTEKNAHHSDNNNFLMITISSLSSSQKYGLFIFTLLLVVGAGISVANKQAPNKLSNENKQIPNHSKSLLTWRSPTILPQVQGIHDIRQAFFSLAPAPKIWISQKKHKPTLFYNGLLVKDISGNIGNCTKKKQGVSAGKICDIDGVRHYLKVVETEDKYADRKTNSLLGIYNLALLKNSLDVTVPEVYIVFEENGTYFLLDNTEVPAVFYVASKEVDSFTTASDLLKKMHRELRIQQQKNPHSTPNLASIKRQLIVSKIGESGIAKLAVAGTFVQDLISNDGNWGYNAQGLVIIDVDNSLSSLDEYLAEAARVHRNIELDFSINTIKMMQQYYAIMLQRSLPVIHPSVDINGRFYQTLIHLYLRACNNAILKIKKQYPELAVELPTKKVNNLLTESFIEAMIYARHNGFFSASKRYEYPSNKPLQHNSIMF